MSTSTEKLRLGPLPRGEIVKLTIVMPAVLKATLDRYAAAHSRIHGDSVDAAALIPHMLAAFIARDRGFKKQHSVGSDAFIRESTVSGLAVAVGADALPEGGTKK